MDWRNRARLSKSERALRSVCSGLPFVSTSAHREEELRLAVTYKDRALALSLFAPEHKKGLTILPSKQRPASTYRAVLGMLQSRSPFFTKLPGEIRDMIFGYLVVCPWGQVMIRMWNGQLAWKTIQTRDIDDWISWRKKDMRRPFAKGSMMAVLLTCHQMLVTNRPNVTFPYRNDRGC